MKNTDSLYYSFEMEAKSLFERMWRHHRDKILGILSNF